MTRPLKTCKRKSERNKHSISNFQIICFHPTCSISAPVRRSSTQQQQEQQKQQQQQHLFNIRASKKVINPSENLARLFQLTVENTLSETKVIFFLQNNIFGYTFKLHLGHFFLSLGIWFSKKTRLGNSSTLYLAAKTLSWKNK